MTLSISSVTATAPETENYERTPPTPPKPVHHPMHADVATISTAAHQVVRSTGVDYEGDSHQVNDQGAVVS
jgi:hypothetical protein